jgi:hypothetical protein
MRSVGSCSLAYILYVLKPSGGYKLPPGLVATSSLITSTSWAWLGHELVMKRVNRTSETNFVILNSFLLQEAKNKREQD